jgi:hypothetical protein
MLKCELSNYLDTSRKFYLIPTESQSRQQSVTRYGQDHYWAISNVNQVSANCHSTWIDLLEAVLKELTRNALNKEAILA